MLRSSALAALGAALLVPQARAQGPCPQFGGFTNAQCPAFRGDPCTEYSGWDAFTSAFGGPNFPDDPNTTSDDALLVQTTSGAVLTSTANIYHPSAAATYEIQDTVPADLQEVVLQVATQGNPRDDASKVLVYDVGAGPVMLAPTTIVETNPGGGPVPGATPRQTAITWDLSGVADVVTSYVLRWQMTASNSSLESVLLDTRTVCAPGIAYCAGDGSGAACPCANANDGSLGVAGCANSFQASGSALRASGAADTANDTLVLTATGLPPSPPVLFFQGSATQNAGAGTPFGDGVRCVGGSVIRLGTKTASGGQAAFGAGVGSDPLVSVQGAVPPGATRYYQAWYRNVPGVCGSGFNLSNGYEVTWL